jgi:hypothetical protein
MYIAKFSFNKMKNKNYHTVGTVPKITTLSERFQKLPHSEQFKKLPHCRNSSKNYHTVGTVSKITTLSEQFQKLPHCRNSSKIQQTEICRNLSFLTAYSNSTNFKFKILSNHLFFIQISIYCLTIR